MNKKIVLSIVAIFAALSMANFTMSQEAYAYKSDVNPIDSRNVPDSELDREIRFLDDNLHRQLNNFLSNARPAFWLYPRRDDFQPITIREARAVDPEVANISMNHFYNISNIEGIQYFNGIWGTHGVSFSGTITDFRPLPSPPSSGRAFGYCGGMDCEDIMGHNSRLEPRITISELGVLRNNDNISSIYLKNIDTLKDGILPSVVNESLTEIRMINCNLTDSQTAVLSSIKSNIEILEFGGNYLEDVSNIFSLNLEKIDRFSLVNNDIVSIPEYALSIIADRPHTYLYSFSGNKIIDVRLFDVLFIDFAADSRQRPEITVRSKTFANPLRDKNGNSIPVQETEFIKNGENGTIVLLVNDQKGSVSTGFDNTRGFDGILTINYDFTQPELSEPAKESPVGDIKAPSTGFGQDYLSFVAVVILAIATLVFVNRQNKIRL